MATEPVPFVSAEEYLEFDRKSEVRNEYMRGEIIPMAGGTPWHSLIAANTTIAVGRRLVEGGCGVFDANLRVCADREASYAYPDVTVVCGPLEYVDEKKDTVVNPKVVVEVLSPATRNYELGDKARMYLRIASLSDLLLIEQREVWIEHWRRQANGWDIEVVQGLAATISIESIGCDVLVSELYSGVEFSQMATETVPFVSAEEYLEFDRRSEVRNEYFFGKIIPMA
jgi:Uma2 family endonuclease